MNILELLKLYLNNNLSNLKNNISIMTTSELQDLLKLINSLDSNEKSKNEHIKSIKIINNELNRR
jgi:hypothetical protein